MLKIAKKLPNFALGFSRISFASPPPHPTPSQSGTDGDQKFWAPPIKNLEKKTLGPLKVLTLEGRGVFEKRPQIFQGKLSLYDFPWGPIILMSFWGLKGGLKNFLWWKVLSLLEVPKNMSNAWKKVNHETTPPYLRDQFKTYDQKVRLPKIISRIKYVFQTEIWYRFQFYSQKLNLDFKSEIRN